MRQTVIRFADNGEAELAFANLEGHHSLRKIKAPVEYQALGRKLTETRRSNAEAGSTHITARKLGGMFEGVVPATPNLLAAYGKRVSEIAEAAHSRFEGIQGRKVEKFTWAEGTSIWAAATSSQSALKIQLLACMLARAYHAPKAISIWMELVAERTRRITLNFPQKEAPGHSRLDLMAENNMSRSQLAEWDASARAWLRAADEIQNRQHQRLLHILRSTPRTMPSNQDISLYDHVLNAWEIAMTTLEKLTAGPIFLCHRAILLAMGAWHIYPDIFLLGPPSEKVLFSDNLVKSVGEFSIIDTPLSDATKASGLERNQEPNSHVQGLASDNLRSRHAPFHSPEYLFALIFADEVHPKSRFSKSRCVWDSPYLVNEGYVIDVDVFSTTGFPTTRPIQYLGTAPIQAYSTVRNGSPDGTVKSPIHLPHSTVSLRLIFLRHIVILGATLVLFSSLATALVLIWAVGHSISDAFTAASWVFPAGAVLLYVIKSCLGGEVEERISPFS